MLKIQSEPGAAEQKLLSRHLSILPTLTSTCLLCLLSPLSSSLPFFTMSCTWIISCEVISSDEKWLTLTVCSVDQVELSQDLSMCCSERLLCPLWAEQCVRDSTWRGTFMLQRASCYCYCWSCFGKVRGDSCWEIDSFLGLITTFFSPLEPYAALALKKGVKNMRLPPKWKAKDGLTITSTTHNMYWRDFGQRHNLQFQIKPLELKALWNMESLTLLQGSVLCFIVFSKCLNYCGYFYTLILPGCCVCTCACGACVQ